MKPTISLFMGLLLGSVGSGCSAAPVDTAHGNTSEPEVSLSTAELSSNALTKRQASTVLELVDDICGDTWCEGDHNFHFDQVQCKRACGNNPGNCRLAFRVFPYDSDLQSGPTYLRSCETPGFNGFASLVDTASNGYQSLNWEYYDALSACISELESQLPPI